MSDQKVAKPTLEAGKISVKYCPFCGIGPFGECSNNMEIDCSTEIGGCGKHYRVIVVQ